uniref:Putative secreted protein n=1 Tax=Anopheles darlingi TaxID=43151 RepID=A0A2M4D4A5_ANODA
MSMFWRIFWPSALAQNCFSSSEARSDSWRSIGGLRFMNSSCRAADSRWISRFSLSYSSSCFCSSVTATSSGPSNSARSNSWRIRRSTDVSRSSSSLPVYCRNRLLPASSDDFSDVQRDTSVGPWPRVVLAVLVNSSGGGVPARTLACPLGADFWRLNLSNSRGYVLKSV